MWSAEDRGVQGKEVEDNCPIISLSGSSRQINPLWLHTHTQKRLRGVKDHVLSLTPPLCLLKLVLLLLAALGWSALRSRSEASV